MRFGRSVSANATFEEVVVIPRLRQRGGRTACYARQWMTTKRDVARKPKEVPFPLSLLFIPILFVGAALSYPYLAVVNALLRRKERRFEAEMLAANRSFMWDGSIQSLVDRGGTLIEEWFCPKGPVRWWWTRDDISATSPHVFTEVGPMALFDDSYDAFSVWCHDHYLNRNATTLFVASSYGTRALPRNKLEEKLALPVVAIKSATALRWAQRFSDKPR